MARSYRALDPYTRDALYWATMGGAKALRLDRRIGSLTPGKQADVMLIDTRGMNVFLAVPGGDPCHAAVMYAEAADVTDVLVAGRFLKRSGKLTFPAEGIERLRSELLDARCRMMREGDYVYRPTPPGPPPDRFLL